jgi:hypothetical protein
MIWPKHLLTIDFETFWSDDYTLKKLSTEEYIRDARFKAHGASIKYGAAPSRWITAADLPAFLGRVPWDDVALLAQHAQFDGLILAHHYAIVPAMYVDTLSMSRMALPRQRHSLEQLAIHFDLPSKGNALAQTKNVLVLPDWMERQLGEYSCHDADLTYEVFRRLLPSIPHTEFEIIDQTIRLFTQPRLLLDRPRARALLARVIRSKRSALQRLGVERAELASTDKFAALLEERFGIAVEMKHGKRGPIPALAKSDQFMKALLDDENPDVQALSALRLKVKSTLEETRLRRLLSMHSRGPLPVYLNFAGAHTFRWSGGDKMNWQNFPRGSELRKCILAPPGTVLVVADLSQIEARMLNTLAEQWDILSLFESGDPYSVLASKFFGRHVDRKNNPEDKGAGHVGKVGELGLGYGMGPWKLRLTLRQGAMGGAPVKIDMETAETWVAAYRESHKKVTEFWAQAETAIQLLFDRQENYPWGPMVIDRGYIRLPNGTALDYTGIVREEGEWRMRDRQQRLVLNQFGAPVRLYGGLMTENVDQALSRVVMSQAMPAIAARYPIVMTTHDELAALAPIEEAYDPDPKTGKMRRHKALDFMIETMTQRPAWLPMIPLAAEGAFDACYSK